MNKNLFIIRLFPFFFLHGYHIESIKLINERAIRKKPLRPPEKVAKDAIKRLHKAIE
jgi:hypothetical protein